MKRVIPALFLMLLLPWSNAQAQQVSVEKIWFGEYTVGATKEIADPKSPTGKRFESEGTASPTVQTDTISIRNDMYFGFGYVVSGPRGNIDIEQVYFLPDETGRSSTTRKPDFLSKAPISAGKRDFIGWHIGKGELTKIKTGVYIFQVRYQNRVLAEQWFNVQR